MTDFYQLRQNILKQLMTHFTHEIWRKFAIWLLIDSTHGVIQFTKPDSDQYNAIKQVSQLYIDNCQDEELWIKAMDASSAAYVAAYTAKSVARAALIAAARAAFEACAYTFTSYEVTSYAEFSRAAAAADAAEYAAHAAYTAAHMGSHTDGGDYAAHAGDILAAAAVVEGTFAGSDGRADAMQDKLTALIEQAKEIS